MEQDTRHRRNPFPKLQILVGRHSKLSDSEGVNDTLPPSFPPFRGQLINITNPINIDNEGRPPILRTVIIILAAIICGGGRSRWAAGGDRYRLALTADIIHTRNFVILPPVTLPIYPPILLKIRVFSCGSFWVGTNINCLRRILINPVGIVPGFILLSFCVIWKQVSRAQLPNLIPIRPIIIFQRICTDYIAKPHIVRQLPREQPKINPCYLIWLGWLTHGV